MINALCIDLDDFYICLKEYGYNLSNKKIFFQEETLKLLADLKKKKIKCSFFIPGHVFKNDKNLVRYISSEGHHVCSHSLNHVNISNLSDDDLEYELMKSKDMLENLINIEVNTFKAPAWSISNNYERIYNVLSKTGYKYDHSLRPKFFSKLSNNLYLPIKYKKIWLIPPTGLNILGFKILFCGGFYTKYFSNLLVKFFFKNINQNFPINYFFHPYEYIPSSYNKKFYKYNSVFASFYGHYLGKHKSQLEYLSKYFDFSTLKIAYKKIYDE